MKRIAALCAFMLVAASALAQTPVQPVGPPSGDSPVKYKQVVNSAGAASVLEAAPAYAQWAQDPPIFSDSLSNYGRTADSTHVCIPTAGFHTLTFTFNDFCRAAVDSAMIIAFEVRACNTAAGNAAADTATDFHMQGVLDLANRPSELRGFTGQDTIGHPLQPVATHGIRTSVTGAADVRPSGPYEAIIVLRSDPAFAQLGPEHSPKGFAVVLKNWWAPYARVRLRVLNNNFEGAEKPTGPTDPKWRWCQLAIVLNKSAQ